MPKRISIEPHLTVAELKIRYRKTKNPVERSRCQIILLLLQGQPLKLVEQLSGYCQQSVYSIVRRYNQGGSKALQDGRRCNLGAGRNPLLDSEQEALLWHLLQTPPPEAQEWDGRVVADWISIQVGRSVSTETGRRYLKKIRSQLRSPRCKSSQH